MCPRRPVSRTALAAGSAATAALVAGLTVAGPQAVAAPSAAPGARSAAPSLDLGPADLPEARSTTTVQPGVTLTRITRGGTDPSLVWTLESQIPSSDPSPDPDAPPQSVSDEPSARAEASRLQGKGFDARVEAVRQPATADVPAGVLGYRVRVGRYTTKEAADADNARLAAAGETATSVYTGWDGERSARGPWHVNVVRIDPRSFAGRLAASFGPDLHDRETTSALSQAAGATLGVNAGYFVLDPKSGAPGDPRGAGV
jgi:hypothetical protein